MQTAGQERRAGRLTERLRGAQRVEVADESFNLSIGGLGVTPSGTGKRKRDGVLSENTAGRFARLTLEDASGGRRGLEGPRLEASDGRGEEVSPSQAAAKRVSEGSPSQVSARRVSEKSVSQASAKRGNEKSPSQASPTRVSEISRPQASAKRVPDESPTQASAKQAQENSRQAPATQSPENFHRASAKRIHDDRSGARRTRPSLMEEVAESPANKPGSGKRRSVHASTGRQFSDSAGPGSSSPLVQMARRMRAASHPAQDSQAADAEASALAMVPQDADVLARETRDIDVSAHDTRNIDASAVVEHDVSAEDSRDIEALAREAEEIDILAQDVEDVEFSTNAAHAEEELAEEVDAVQAARVLGRNKRRAASPLLGSGTRDEAASPTPPQPKRRRQRAVPSPAVQKGPTRKARQPKANGIARNSTAQDVNHAPTTTHDVNHASTTTRDINHDTAASHDINHDTPTTRDINHVTPTTRDTTTAHDESRSTIPADTDDVVEITVQRWTNLRRRRPADADADADTADPLHLDTMPFANRSAETAVDVLAQICREVVAATAAQLGQLAEAAEAPARKKECRIKRRAVEAFGDELESRLLQHAIHLDHWHALRKQLRQTQRQRSKLRDEILRLCGEREQVALRMDAIRSKHQAHDEEATRRIDTSTLMTDVEAAVEQGRQAAELDRAAQRRARVGNLELMIARVAEQASSASAGGGLLRQVQDFNNLLERAARELESR